MRISMSQSSRKTCINRSHSPSYFKLKEGPTYVDYSSVSRNISRGFTNKVKYKHKCNKSMIKAKLKFKDMLNSMSTISNIEPSYSLFYPHSRPIKSLKLTKNVKNQSQYESSDLNVPQILPNPEKGCMRFTKYLIPLFEWK